MPRPNKVDEDYSMYNLRISTKDLEDIKKMSKELSYENDLQISVADIMRYCILNSKKTIKNYFKKVSS
jgi:hypothetical protein